MWGAGGKKRSDGDYEFVKNGRFSRKREMYSAKCCNKRCAQGIYAAQQLRKTDENGKAEKKRAQRFYILQLFASSGPTLLRPNGYWRFG